jgi:hypothetical protein
MDEDRKEKRLLIHTDKKYAKIEMRHPERARQSLIRQF